MAQWQRLASFLHGNMFKRVFEAPSLRKQCGAAQAETKRTTKQRLESQLGKTVQSINQKADRLFKLSLISVYVLILYIRLSKNNKR